MAPSRALVFTIIVTALGASFQFYNSAVVNTSQSVVEKWMNDTYYEKGIHLSESTLTMIWSVFVGTLCAGALCGSVATAYVAENLGRRNGLICNGVINVLGGICELISKSTGMPELIFVGRFILGINVGLACGLAPMYLTEIAPVSLRGTAGTAHQIASAASDCFSLFLTLPFILGSSTLWPVSFSFAALPALILVILLPFSHESPRFLLLTKGNRIAAERAVQYFCDKDTAKQTFESLIKEAAIAQKRFERIGKPKIGDMFTSKSLRTPLLISIFVMIAQQFTGCAAIFAYSTDVFVQANLPIEIARFCTLAVGICYFLFTLPAAVFIEKAGRRKLLLTQLIGCSLALTVTSVFTSIRLNYGYEWASNGSIAGIVLYMCVYGFGSPVPWIIASELFSQEYRSLAVTFCTFTAFLGGFLISLGYLPFQRAVGVEFSFLPFIICMLIAAIFIYLLLPETKNKSIQEIIKEFRRNKNSLSNRLSLHLSSNLSEHNECEPLLNKQNKVYNSDPRTEVPV